MKYIAIEAEGQRDIHAIGEGSYATLCGLDGEDHHEHVKQTTGKLRRGEKITCQQCWLIWKHAKTYRTANFEAGHIRLWERNQ